MYFLVAVVLVYKLLVQALKLREIYLGFVYIEAFNGVSANASLGHFFNPNAALAIELDEVALNVGFGQLTCDKNGAKSAGFEKVQEDVGFSLMYVEITIALHHNTIEVTLLHGICKDQRAVVENRDSHLIDTHLIHGNETLHLRIDHNSFILAVHEHILDYYRLGVRPLHVHTGQQTRGQGVVTEDESVLRLEVGYHTPAFEVNELAVLDDGVGVFHVDTGGHVLLRASAAEFAEA